MSLCTGTAKEQDTNETGEESEPASSKENAYSEAAHPVSERIEMDENPAHQAAGTATGDGTALDAATGDAAAVDTVTVDTVTVVTQAGADATAATSDAIIADTVTSDTVTMVTAIGDITTEDTTTAV